MAWPGMDKRLSPRHFRENTAPYEILVGLALAYFTYSLKLPLTMRSVFYPFLGERILGWLGDLIDILAVLATVFGLATSLLVPSGYYLDRQEAQYQRHR